MAGTFLQIDGFDSYATASQLSMEYTIPAVAYTCGIITNGGRFGGGCLNLTGDNSYLQWTDQTGGGLLSEVCTGFAFNLQTTHLGATTLVEFACSYGVQCMIQYNPQTGVWYLTSGLGVVMSFGIYGIPLYVWHWIEVDYNNADGGSAAAWVNGNEIGFKLITDDITASANLSPFGSFFSNVSIGSAFNAGTFYADDWYIASVDGPELIGDTRITTLVPVSDAGPNDGTPSTAGPHYLMVNEAQWNSTNSITILPATGQEELFNMTNLTVVGSATVFVMRVASVIEYQGSGDTGTLFGNSLTSSGGVTTPGVNLGVEPFTSYLYLDNISTSVGTIAGINNTACGFGLLVA
jgi:hypothetical protein